MTPSQDAVSRHRPIPACYHYTRSQYVSFGLTFDCCFRQGQTAKGVDSMYVPNAAKLNHDKLQEICKKDKLCIGETRFTVSTQCRTKNVLIDLNYLRFIDGLLKIFVIDVGTN